MFQKVFLRTIRARRFRSGMIALCAIGAIVLAAVGTTPLLANPGTVIVRVDPATRAAPVNGTFTVDIVANNVDTEMNPEGLGAYEFDLVHDPDYLEVDSVSDAGELDDTKRTVNELGPNIDSGRTTFAAYSHPPVDTTGPVSPTVVLATVTLRAKRAGVTTLNLENALLTDTQANAWPDDGAGRELNESSGAVWSITGAFFHFTDLNGDGWEDPAIWDPASYKWKWLVSDGSGGFATQMTTLRFGRDVSIPLTGDINGDGYTDLILWDTDTQRWRIKRSDGSGGYIKTMRLKFGLPDSIPLIANFNNDEFDDICSWDPEKKLRCKPFDGSNFGSTQFFNLRPGDSAPLH